MRHRAAEWQAHSDDDDDDDDEVTVLEESSKLGNMDEVVETAPEGQGVNLQVRNSRDEKKGYRYGMDRPLLKLLETYCKDHDLDAKKMNLIFDGETVDCQTATPLSLEMEDDDVIDVVEAKKQGKNKK